MERQQIAGAGQRRRRGLMTGIEERQDLIAKLTVAHPLPGLLVTRIH